MPACYDRSPGQGPPATVVEEVRWAIEGAGEVLCTHALRREGLPALSVLTELQLVKPIRTGVPACSAHGCPFSGDCEHQAVFESGGPGRAGRKARVVPAARLAAANKDALAARLLALPLCQFVLQALRDGPRTIFALNTLLLDRCLGEIEASGQVETTAFGRSELAMALRILVELGRVRWLPDGATVALLDGLPGE